MTLGASAGWSSGDVTLDDEGGDGTQDGILGALHVDYARAGYRLGAGLLAGRLDQSTSRNVTFGGVASAVEGDTDSTLFGGYVLAGVPIGSFGRWWLDASGRASLVRQTQDAYVERGANPLRLAVDELRATTLEVQGLVSAARRLGGEGGGMLRFDLGVRHQALQGGREIDATFLAGNAPVRLQGDGRDTTQAVVGAAVHWPLTQRVTFSAVYAGQLGGQDEHEGRLGLSLGF